MVHPTALGALHLILSSIVVLRRHSFRRSTGIPWTKPAQRSDISWGIIQYQTQDACVAHLGHSKGPWSPGKLCPSRIYDNQAGLISRSPGVTIGGMQTISMSHYTEKPHNYLDRTPARPDAPKQPSLPGVAVLRCHDRHLRNSA